MPSQPNKATKATRPKAVANVVEFLELASLADIIIHEERGRLVQWTEQELTSLEFPLTANSLGVSNDEQNFAFRFRVRFTDESAEYVADIAARYQLDQPAVVEEVAITEFAERVAFMAVYPFIRASIFGSAARMLQPAPVLGMVKQGEFHIGTKMQDDDLQSSFLDHVSEASENYAVRR